MPETKSRKFGYADDWALAIGHRDFKVTEDILTRDLSTMGKYFRNWRLQPSAAKTEVSSFHLNNRLANKELHVHFENRLLSHNKYPKYLGITLDRTLSFKEHLTRTAAKLRSRNNILQKLCGTTWGSSASTLRTSALGLVYPVAEYCSSTWINSAHVRLIDTQLNQTMRLISGTIRCTPTFWLPILSHIPPPTVRREYGLIKVYNDIQNNHLLPVHHDLPGINRNRLRSRHPPLNTARRLAESKFNMTDRWKQLWKISATPEQQTMPCITTKPPGFELPRKIWSTLNRVRTNCGRCADSLHKWKKIPSPGCNCGAERQTIQHIVQECPLTAFSGDPAEFLMATQECVDYIKDLNVIL